METGSDAKTSRLTWHNILSILQKYPKDPLSYGRKYWNWAIIGFTQCTGWQELIAVGDN